MSAFLSSLGQEAAKAVVPLFIFGIGFTVVGIALQLAQNYELIGPQPWLGQATIFGLMSKIGGISMISGLIFGALRLTGGDGPRALQPLDVPLSARAGPATELIRPTRVLRQPATVRAE